MITELLQQLVIRPNRRMAVIAVKGFKVVSYLNKCMYQQNRLIVLILDLLQKEVDFFIILAQSM